MKWIFFSSSSYKNLVLYSGISGKKWPETVPKSPRWPRTALYVSDFSSLIQWNHALKLHSKLKNLHQRIQKEENETLWPQTQAESGHIAWNSYWYSLWRQREGGFWVNSTPVEGGEAMHSGPDRQIKGTGAKNSGCTMELGVVMLCSCVKWEDW